MNETHVREQLSAYLDKALSAEEQQRVETHLQECVNCKAVFDELNSMVHWMKSVPKPSPKFGLETRMMARLKEERSQKWFLSWGSHSGGLATAMIAVLVFVMVRENRLDKRAGQSAPHEEFQQRLYEPSKNPLPSDKRMEARAKKISSTSKLKDGVGQRIMRRDTGTGEEFELKSMIPMKKSAPPLSKPENIVAETSDVEDTPSSPPLKIAKSEPPSISNDSSDKMDSLNSRFLGNGGSLRSKQLLDAKESNIASGTAGAKPVNEKGQFGLADQLAGIERIHELQKSSAPPKAFLPPQAEFSGLTCGIKNPEQLVVRSQAEWESLLKRMGNPTSPFPSLDFSKQMVAAVFMGEQPSAGYSARIVSEDLQNQPPGQVLIINIRKKFPARDAMVAMMLTQPYTLRVLPRFGGPVQFQEVK